MKNGSNPEFRFVHLDMVRGLAALLVCVQHLRHVQFIDYGVLPTKPSLLDKIFYFMTGQGHNAVMIFFVLSGFFVGGSVAKDFSRDSWSWPRFAIRRMTRLWVVLIPALLLTLVWDYLGQTFTSSGPLGLHDLFTFLANLFFTQSIFAPAFGTNSVLWSVAYEFWYYLLFPLFFGALFFRGFTKERMLYGVLLLICLSILPHKVLMGGIIWLMGYGAYRLLQVKTFTNIVPSTIALGVGVLGLVLSECLAGTPHGAAPGDFTLISFRDLCTGLSFSLMVPALAVHQPASTWYRWASVGLSDISYTLYAVHFPLVVFLSYSLIRSKDAVPSITSYTLFVGYLMLILLYATAIWWLFEARTGQVRKFLERKFERGQAHLFPDKG